MRRNLTFAALSVLGIYGLSAQYSVQRYYGSGGDRCVTWVAARANSNARPGLAPITQAALFEELRRGFVSGFGLPLHR